MKLRWLLALVTVAAVGMAISCSTKEDASSKLDDLQEEGCWDTHGSDPECNAYYAGYEQGHDEGFLAFGGYDDGYGVGYEFGSNGGHSGRDYLGSSRWCQDPSERISYPLDFDDGYAEGEYDGCEDGYEQGHRDGFREGQRDCKLENTGEDSFYCEVY
jgi:hypothetical protein